ncbi:hypothetical protein H6771_03240 [Candidatus Peribacteria bacterium]|nr:hypothetical protein [Candidatus Peribacteria bacterium]
MTEHSAPLPATTGQAPTEPAIPTAAEEFSSLSDNPFDTPVPVVTPTAEEELRKAELDDLDALLADSEFSSAEAGGGAGFWGPLRRQIVSVSFFGGFVVVAGLLVWLVVGMFSGGRDEDEKTPAVTTPMVSNVSSTSTSSEMRSNSGSSSVRVVTPVASNTSTSTAETSAEKSGFWSRVKGWFGKGSSSDTTDASNASTTAEGGSMVTTPLADTTTARYASVTPVLIAHQELTIQRDTLLQDGMNRGLDLIARVQRQFNQPLETLVSGATVADRRARLQQLQGQIVEFLDESGVVREKLYRQIQGLTTQMESAKVASGSATLALKEGYDTLSARSVQDALPSVVAARQQYDTAQVARESRLLILRQLEQYDKGLRSLQNLLSNNQTLIEQNLGTIRMTDNPFTPIPTTGPSFGST